MVNLEKTGQLVHVSNLEPVPQQLKNLGSARMMLAKPQTKGRCAIGLTNAVVCRLLSWQP